MEPVQSVQMTSTKLITIEKIKEKDIILTMGQGLKKALLINNTRVLGVVKSGYILDLE